MTLTMPHEISVEVKLQFSFGKIFFNSFLLFSLSGVLMENALTHAGQFRYLHPDIFETAVWLPCVQITSAVGMGNLGRYLKISSRS